MHQTHIGPTWINIDRRGPHVPHCGLWPTLKLFVSLSSLRRQGTKSYFLSLFNHFRAQCHCNIWKITCVHVCTYAWILDHEVVQCFNKTYPKSVPLKPGDSTGEGKKGDTAPGGWLGSRPPSLAWPVCRVGSGSGGRGKLPSPATRRRQFKVEFDKNCNNKQYLKLWQYIQLVMAE